MAQNPKIPESLLITKGMLFDSVWEVAREYERNAALRQYLPGNRAEDLKREKSDSAGLILVGRL